MSVITACCLRFHDGIIEDIGGNTWTNHGSKFVTGIVGTQAIYSNGGTWSNQGTGGFIYTQFDPDKFRITGDFTITTHYRQDTSSWGAVLPINGGASSSNPSGQLTIGAQTDSANINFMSFVHGSFSTGRIPMNNNIPSNGKEYYITFTRSGNTVYAFIDGKKVGEYTDNVGSFDIIGTNNQVWVCRGEADYHSWSNLGGALDDFIILNGAALWTEDFEVPTSYLNFNATIDRVEVLTHLYEKQHNNFSVVIDVLDYVSTNNISFKLMLGDTVLSDYSYNNIRYLNINSFGYGDNVVKIVNSDNNTIKSVTINKESLYRSQVIRTFKDYDGHYNNKGITKELSTGSVFKDTTLKSSVRNSKNVISLHTNINKLTV